MPVCPKCNHEVNEEALYCGNCAAPLKEDVDSFLGKCIDGKYYIQERIASGGMGDVYLARQKGVGQEVAIKKLKREYYQDRVIVERFINEARLYGRVTHPNAVKLHDLLNVNGQICIIMEYVNGKTLTDYVESGYVFSTRQIIDIGLQIADALATMHQAGIIHRDLKTENIMLIETVSGRFSVKILDFGIAKFKDGRSSGMTQEGVIVGTPEFMSPEQCFGTPVDNRADIYSFGILMYVMICGHLPFESSSALALLQKQVSEPLPVMKRPDSSKILPGLEGIVRKCAMKAADDRYQSFVDVIADLTCLQEGRETSVELVSVSRKKKRSDTTDVGDDGADLVKSGEKRKRVKRTGERSTGKTGEKRKRKRPSDPSLDVSGDNAAFEVSGDGAALEVSGDRAALEVSGDRAALEVSGDGAALEVSGDGASLEVSGDGAALEVSGDNAAVENSADADGKADSQKKPEQSFVLHALSGPEELGDEEIKFSLDDGELNVEDIDINESMDGEDLSIDGSRKFSEHGEYSLGTVGEQELEEGAEEFAREASEGPSKVWGFILILVLIGAGWAVYWMLFPEKHTTEYGTVEVPEFFKRLSGDVPAKDVPEVEPVAQVEPEPVVAPEPEPARDPVPASTLNSHAVFERGVNRALLAEAEKRLNEGKLDVPETLLKAVNHADGPEAERLTQLKSSHGQFKSALDRANNLKRRQNCEGIPKLLEEIPDSAEGMRSSIQDIWNNCQKELSSAPSRL